MLTIELWVWKCPQPHCDDAHGLFYTDEARVTVRAYDLISTLVVGANDAVEKLLGMKVVHDCLFTNGFCCWDTTDDDAGMPMRSVGCCVRIREGLC